MPEPSLHLARIELELPALFQLARRRRLPPNEEDLGYLLHCQLGELFGPLAPKPFAAVDAGAAGIASHGSERAAAILGYTAAGADDLVRQATTYADPAAYAACCWDRLAVKPMPATWPAGLRLGFEARICPVVRRASEGDGHAAGVEVDAFLARCWAAGPEVRLDREAVYRDWLAAELARRGGARLLSAGLTGFRRARLLRREQDAERKSHQLERPDARVRGELEVTDGPAFAALLARGLGRHRAFGFGMLLLRPARGR